MSKSAAMDVNFIRKVNLQRLIEQEGSARKFAEKIETDPAYLSSLLSEKGDRNPGDELMRRVEQVYGLPEGSLDFWDEKTQEAMMKLALMPAADQQESFDFIGYRFDRADLSIASTPKRLTRYFKAIGKMIETRERLQKKP